MRGLWTALRWARRSIALLVIAALLVTNVLAFASSAFVSVVSSVAGLAGLKTVQARRVVAQRAVVRRIGQRTARGATRSLGGAFTQSLPFAGGGFVLALTAWEVRDYCATLDDLRALDPLDDIDAQSLCGVEPITAEALRGRLGLHSWMRIPSETDVAAALGFSPDDPAPLDPEP